MQLRKGCDGRPGFVLKFDACGICGGDGKRCRGCDGGINSGAKIGKIDFPVSASKKTVSFICFYSCMI